MESYGFFNGDTEYGQEEFNRYFNSLYESGVSLVDGNLTLKVTAGASAVTLSPGFAIVGGYYYYNDTDKLITVTRDASYTRIDRIVVRLDVASMKVTTECKKGVAASSPVAPALTRNNLFYEISLCQITVPKSGAMTVIDERFNNSVCGAIRPKNMTEYRDMVAEFDRQITAWFKNQQGTGWRNIYIQANTPADPVVGSIWIDR